MADEWRRQVIDALLYSTTSCYGDDRDLSVLFGDGAQCWDAIAPGVDCYTVPWVGIAAGARLYRSRLQRLSDDELDLELQKAVKL
jgi:hypothetical protein